MPITRPGPSWLAPGLAPDGVVVRVYAVPSCALLLERRLSTDADVEALAEGDAEFALALESVVCLVAYDGDTGQRLDRRAFVA